MAFLLITCRDKESATICTPDNTFYIPSDLSDRFYFKDSSYWIYKDSITGQLDSFWVEKSLRDVGSMEKIYKNTKGRCFEGGSYYMNTKNTGKYFFHLEPYPTSIPENKKQYTLNIEYGNYLLENLAFDDNHYRNDGKEYGWVDTLQQIDVSGVTYSDILRKSNVEAMYPGMFYISYYVRNKGLVKFVRYNKSVWELVRYRIKQ